MKNDRALVTAAAAAGGITTFLGLRLIFSALRKRTRAPKRPITIRGGVVVIMEGERCDGIEFAVDPDYEHDLNSGGSHQPFEERQRVTDIVFRDLDGISPAEVKYPTVSTRDWSVEVIGPDSSSMKMSDHELGGTKGVGIVIDLFGSAFKYSNWDAVKENQHYSLCVDVSKIVITIDGKSRTYSATPQLNELRLPRNYILELQWPE